MLPRLTKIVFLLLGACAVVSAPAAMGAPKGIAVAVSPKNALSNLTVGDLRKILGGNKRIWPGGAAIKIFTRAPGTPERAALLKLLGQTEAEYKQYWTSKVYLGDVDSEPMILPSEGMQREALTAYPGAITLIGADAVRPGMKILKIDGKSPDDENYPLRP
jgi:hypothetical protein